MNTGKPNMSVLSQNMMSFFKKSNPKIFTCRTFQIQNNIPPASP